MGEVGLAGLFCFGQTAYYRNDFVDGGSGDCIRKSPIIGQRFSGGLDQCYGWHEYGSCECKRFKSVV